MRINTILDQIDNGSVALPEFQRGFVWNGTQVRGLMDSLYRQHPVGSLLTWETRTDNVTHRGEAQLQPGFVRLLLDGQQRVTALYGMIRGNPPPFFEGNEKAFMNLFFNLETETFEFYGPVRMRDNPLWISVTDLMKSGIGKFMDQIYTNEVLRPDAQQYIARLNQIERIKEIDLHVEEVTGEDKTVDLVVEIFNRVNSGGTKLSKGDLALAKICAEWPSAREQLNSRLNKWKQAGFVFRLEWLLRCVNSLVTGEALFSALNHATPGEVDYGLGRSERHIDYLLNLISSRLGLDHDRVLGSPYSFPLMVRYIEERGGRLSDHRERDRLLFWYVHTLLWGRYSGSTETVLNQDLEAISQPDGGLDRLIGTLRRNRGNLRIAPQDLIGSTIGARFYPLLYMLTRVYHGRDWDTGVELSNHMLGSLSSLQVHHIFPKSRLYEFGYERNDVNALANFTFLTQDTNLLVSNRDPAEYLNHFMTHRPRVIESHWIPLDPELWQIRNYPYFLDARRELLAAAANEFLDGLYSGSLPDVSGVEAVLDRPVRPLGGVINQDEEQILLDANIWVIDRRLPEGELSYELVDQDTGDLIAILDLAWPDGIQQGYSQPVALLIDEDSELEAVASQAGFALYTDVPSLKRYVEHVVLAVDVAAD